MKKIFILLVTIVLLTNCDNLQLNHKETVKQYYNAFDSGNFNALNAIINDSITIVSGDFATHYNHDSFHVFFKWDSIFKPSYQILDLEEKNTDVIVTITQKNIRNEFLKNNPLKFKVKVTFENEKISRIEELEYIDVNWNDWTQKRDSLENWVELNHQTLNGFINDMTMKGAINYIKAIELYEALE